jgi:hypothetical protein
MTAGILKPTLIDASLPVCKEEAYHCRIFVQLTVMDIITAGC